MTKRSDRKERGWSILDELRTQENLLELDENGALGIEEAYEKAFRQLEDGKAVIIYWQAKKASERSKVVDIVAVRTLIRLHALEEADTVLNDAELRYPNDFYLTALRSDVRQAEGDILEALRLAVLASTLEPSHLVNNYRIGVLAIKARDFDKALHFLTLSLNTSNTSITNDEDPFSFLCLLRIYAVVGESGKDSIIDGLRKLDLEKLSITEVGQFLHRLASANTSSYRLKMQLGLIATDSGSKLIYAARIGPSKKIAGYSIYQSDLSQFHVYLPHSLVSGSYGAVMTTDTCFALDHGFFSHNALSEFDLENKIILTHDMIVDGFDWRSRTVHVRQVGKPEALDDEVLVLPPCHYTNFGHFVHDVLLNKYAFDRLRQAYPGIKPLLLRRFPSAIFRSAFEATFGRDYRIVNDPHALYMVRAAHIVTLPHAMWPSKGEVCVGPARYLRSHLSSKSVGSRKLFVARKNVDDLSAQHRRAFEEFGFTSLFLEDMEEDEYFDAFANASHIVGEHGAGLMNFVFAPLKVKVAELKRQGGNWHSIATFAAAVGANFHTFEREINHQTLRVEIARWLVESV